MSNTENIQFEKKVSSLVTLPKVKHTRLFFMQKKGDTGKEGVREEILCSMEETEGVKHGKGIRQLSQHPFLSFLYSLKQWHIEEALKEFYIKTASQDCVSALKLFMRPT